MRMEPVTRGSIRTRRCSSWYVWSLARRSKKSCKASESLSDTDVWTRKEFSQKGPTILDFTTGAGGAILTAAFLGFFIGLAVVSQAVYATTMEHLEEFATLKALAQPTVT